MSNGLVRLIALVAVAAASLIASAPARAEGSCAMPMTTMVSAPTAEGPTTTTASAEPASSQVRR
jgi:hypothetical protein